MAKATFVKSAQKNIYVNGKTVSYVSKKGKRSGQTLQKLDKTIPSDEKDRILIAKGEPYYWWAFQYGGKHFSKNPPKQSQLTQSAYLGQLYSIQEQMDELECSDVSDLGSIIDSIKSDIENLKYETEGSLDNMPDSLKESPTGQLLQERIDALDNAISEIEGIDLDYEEPDEIDIINELKDEYDGENEEDWEPSPELIEERRNDKAQEWIDDKINEIQSIGLE